MRVILSAAISLDGCLDDLSSERLVLSNDQDWAEVRALRAECDAILIGAETLRRDNPALVTRDPALALRRRERGLDDDLVKVVVSTKGELDPSARFFTEGVGKKIVLLPASSPSNLSNILGGVAHIIKSEQKTLTASEIVRMLEGQGISSIIVEGGGRVLDAFLSEGMFDEFRLAVAPFFVGDCSAPRIGAAESYINGKDNRLKLLTSRRVGDMSVMYYSKEDITSTDISFIRKTIELAGLCPRSDKAYSVGAVIVTPTGEHFTGYSRETSPHNHAEEEAIIKAEAAGANLIGATMYSSMEPCSVRSSKPKSCSGLIIDKGFARVVFAAKEPDHFVTCEGCATMARAGIRVDQAIKLASGALKVNKHIIGSK